MPPSQCAGMECGTIGGRRRRAPPSTWDRYRELILDLYETQNRPLREVCEIMKIQHGFNATERMYKTKFNTWGVKKYRVDSFTKSIQRKARQLRRAAEASRHGVQERRVLDTTELRHGLEEIKRASKRRPDDAEDEGPPFNPTIEHLDVPPSSNDSSHQSRATSYTGYTPEVTSRPSSTDRGSMLTPESSESSEEHALPLVTLSKSNFPSVNHQTLSGNGAHLEAYAPRPGRASGIPCSAPAYCMYGARGNDKALASQIVNQTMGLSWPSLFSIPTPSDEFQDLMEARIDWSTYHSETIAQKLGDMRGLCTNEDPEFVSPLPETWTSLCFYINILLGQGQHEEATRAMQRAAMIYQMLVEERNDQLLSILNVVLANLFLHGQGALAATLLQQAKTAASTYLDENDAIMVSIDFMIAMALKTTENCGIRILNLRQVAEDMRKVWGENHPYCITADYHLAWRLAMESDLRVEALNILQQTQVRAEHVCHPLDMQTVALITTQARVLGHLGFHSEAGRTMFEALQRIRSWNITEDHPYFVEAKRRYKVFLRQLDRVRSR